MNDIARTSSTRPEEEKPRTPQRRSSYFGYACARSFELRDKLLRGSLTVDDMLDITGFESMRCPVHAKPCHCYRLESYWVNDGNGRLALKLFLKHLEGKTLLAFKALVAANLDRLAELKEMAAEHPKLLAKIKLIATFS
jgi:hypothetical protein